LPLLGEFNPRIEEHLARLGRRLGTEEEFWQQETEKALESMAALDGENLSLDCRRLRELHPALRARVLRQAMQRVRGGLHAISAIHIEQLETLLHRPQPQGEQHLPSLWAGRRYERLWLRRTPPPEPTATTVSIPGAGIFPLPGGMLHVSQETAGGGEDQLTVEFDPVGIEFPLRVRQFLPGDRFRPAGMEGRKKVKDFFIDAKLEREVRCRILVVEGSEILWLIGMRRCAGRRPGSGTVLRLHFQPFTGDNFDC
jgi:tRNA(Ile)-lysidine synthase